MFDGFYFISQIEDEIMSLRRDLDLITFLPSLSFFLWPF